MLLCSVVKSHELWHGPPASAFGHEQASTAARVGRDGGGLGAAQLRQVGVLKSRAIRHSRMAGMGWGRLGSCTATPRGILKSQTSSQSCTAARAQSLE